MSAKRIDLAALAAAEMQRRDIKSVSWGDGVLSDIYGLTGRSAHPLNAMRRVLAAMQSSALFCKSYIHGHDSRGHTRVVRHFTLIG